MLGTDNVDGDKLWVKGKPFDVTAEDGTLEVVGWLTGEVVLRFGGSGGTGGRSFGIGGMSRTSMIALTPADVQLDEPENESEPSTNAGSVVLALLVCCRRDCISPLAGFPSASGALITDIGSAGAGSGGMGSIKLVDAVDGLKTVDALGLGGAVIETVILGEDGAVEAGACGWAWETESRRFSFVRLKARHPPGDFSSFCPSFSTS